MAPESDIRTKLVEDLAVELCRARKQPWLMPDHLAECPQLLELPLVSDRARELGSGHLDAAYEVVASAIAADMEGPEQQAARVFFNLDHERDLRGKERRNLALVPVMKAPTSSWRYSEAHVGLMREVARTILRRQAEAVKISGEDMPSPGGLAGELTRRRVSTIEADAFFEAMATDIGRYKQAFLAGLLLPWSDSVAAQAEPRDLSLVGVAGLISYNTHGTRHESIELATLEHDSATIRMILSNSTPVWNQQFTFPLVDSAAFVTCFLSFGNGKWKTAEEFLCLLDEDAGRSAMRPKWNKWLDSCGCDINHVGAATKDSVPWTQLLFPECHVHRNLWVDDIWPDDADLVTVEQRLERYLAGIPRRP